MLLFVAIFLIGYGFYLLTHIPPDASEEIITLMAMAGKFAILLGCAKIAFFALRYKTRSTHLTIIERIKSRLTRNIVSRRVKR
ncbi:MAG: hypothetical protein Q7U10_04100 [Thermodesulfovibrionia bacterium]|nr:hypothetical protein [Thermodesulfovibrionia bacterium]